MPSEGPRISSAGAGAGGIGPTRTRDQGPRPVSGQQRSRARRLFIDPLDIEAAIDRLTKLLAADAGGPRDDVPSGFYLNILV